MKSLIKTIFIITTALLFSCGEEKSEVRTNVAALKELINLEANPIAVKWAYTQLGDGHMGPSDYTVTAVVQLSEADWNKLKNEHLKQEKLNKELPPDFVADWFTQSVKNSFKDYGDHVTVGAYPVTSFQKSPFLNGFCFFTNNNEVFIHMHTN